MPLPEFVCANWVRSNDGCTERGVYACKSCRLVNYCSPECQKSHWRTHKTDCKNPLGKGTWQPSWALESRAPAFVSNSGEAAVSFGPRKYLWGNVAAYDVLRLHSNEGGHYDKDISLLFAASGDLRNVVETVAQLPETFKRPITVTLNDRDIDIVARNVMLLLIALVVDDTDEAIDCMIHVWYSALIRKVDIDLLQHRIRPLVEDVCTKIAGKSPETFFAKTWTFDQRSLRLTQKKSFWDATLSHFDTPIGLTAGGAQRKRADITLAPSRVDYTDRALFNHSPAHRIAFRRFREDGLLLPFGFPRHEFTEPNPTFFEVNCGWPMRDSADPREGWPAEKVAQISSGPATADLYGKLFYYLRTVLRGFLSRLSKSTVSFQLFAMDAANLPTFLNRARYDRIETSNIADEGWLGIHKTLATLTIFLKELGVNPHATLITFFMNAVEENSTRQDQLASMTPNSAETQALKIYVPPNRGTASRYDPHFLKFLFAREIVSTYDHIFDRHMEKLRFKEVGAILGMVVKENHTIIDKWPYRLRLRPGQPGAQAEFNRLLIDGVTSKERYVEWKLASP